MPGRLVAAATYLPWAISGFASGSPSLGSQTRLWPVFCPAGAKKIRGPEGTRGAIDGHGAQDVNNSGPLADMRGVFFERMSGRIKYFVVGHVAQRTLPPED